VNPPTSAFRRRNDGVLELLPRLDPVHTARRAEIAIAVLFLTVGGGAVLVRNVALAVLLLAGGTALLVPQLLREYQALRGLRRRKLHPELAASNERAPLRVLRGEACGSASARASGIRGPGSAPSPRD
jgi:hypothetical protein